RQTTGQRAKGGCVAIGPDLLSRRGGTPASPDGAGRLIAGRDPDTITQDLDATVAYVKRVKGARPDRLGVIGFCWGGGQSFRYATNNPSLGAFVVCYGPGPDATSIARIRAKGLGVYAENDARVNAGLADVDAVIRTYHKSYRHTVYPGVGHGFRTPRGRLPDDHPATRGAERGQQVFSRAGRGARRQYRDRPPVGRMVLARRNSSRLRPVPGGSGVAQVPCTEHRSILRRSPPHGGKRAVGETGEDLVGVLGLALRGVAQVQHQPLHAGEVGKRAVDLAHDLFVYQGRDSHDRD